MEKQLDRNESKAVLRDIYNALCEKGYDPARQIAGYILSGDPVYITDWKDARSKIVQVDRDELLVVLINNYFQEQ